MREGVKWVPDEHADLFFVTLTKTERHYSPTTMYQDRAITPELPGRPVGMGGGT